VPDVRRAVTEVDADLPIDRVTILSEQVRRGLNQERLVAGLTSVFGMLALGLACFGLFGVLSYVVAQRTNEIGIRLALGAECWRGAALGAGRCAPARGRRAGIWHAAGRGSRGFDATKIFVLTSTNVFVNNRR
jgi:hypothetical protein